MLLNKRAKRLGDFASGTIVVREGSRGAGVLLMPAADSAESRGVRLSSADETLVRDFLVRRASMDPRARANLASRLAAVLVQRYDLVLEGEPETFLERL
jgi:hypothetical protein